MARPARTLVDYLQRAAGVPDAGLRVLDRNGDQCWMAWPTVLGRAARVAGGLRGLGVGRGDRVALVFPTAPELFDAFFGIVLAGAVPVPLYPPVRLGRLDEYHVRTAAMLAAVEARVVLADRRIRRILGETVRAARSARLCLTLNELPSQEPAIADVRPADLALIQFSSGTTRNPRPVGLSHRAVMTQAELLNAFWPDTEEVRHSGVSWLPLYHDMGLIGCVFAALERPGTLTLIPPEAFAVRPAVWLQTISKYRATLSPAPNFAYSLAVQRVRDEEMDGVDLSCWRVALCGAETVVPGVMRAFQQRFARWGFAPEALTPVYGLSEATLAVTFSDPRCPFVSHRFDREALVAAGVAREVNEGWEIVSAGRPLPGCEIRIAGDDGVLPEGNAGRIECRSPSMMDGYIGQPEATARVLNAGWLDTGDVGFLWKGELFLTGRAKDMVLVRGRNYAPDEVERATDDAPGVRTGCVVAVSRLPERENADGEVLLVLVEARRNVPQSDFDAVAQACARHIVAATGLVPERVVVLPPGTLPRTSSGKLRRQDALRLYLTGELEAAPAVTSLHLARAMARSSIAFLRMKWDRLTASALSGNTPVDKR